MTSLREEEKSRCSAGDGFYVFLIVAAIVARQQVVEDAHNTHQEQEEEDAFSKQVAGGATNEFEKPLVKTLACKTMLEGTCVYLPLWGLSHVPNKVLLPDDEIEDPSKGGRS